MTVRISIAQRRARLAERHHLGAPSSSLEAVAADLVGLHATDPVTVFLSAWARLPDLNRKAVEAAMYEDRTVLKVLGMRRTMFVVTPELASVIDAACTKAIESGERRKLIRLIEGQGLTSNGTAWLDRVSADVLALLAERGELSANEIAKAIPELGRKLRLAEGTKWSGEVAVSTRVLFLMGTALQIMRTRPLGSWTSSQYRYATPHEWIARLPALDPAEARCALAERYLRAFGPATRADVAWWTGWPLGQTDAALTACRAVAVEVEDGGAAFVAAADAVLDTAPGHVGSSVAACGDSWVALLPALDSTVMGWKERGWYLGGHKQALFDTNGNAGPTVWCDGRVVGGWGQNSAGAVVYELFEDIGSNASQRLDERAADLTTWMDGVAITPRFRTPLERTLATR